MTHDPYYVEPRKRLTDKRRLQLFLEHNGVCCICGQKIVAATWIVEHVNPLWRDGKNDQDNLAPAHTDCARAKTKTEAKDRAKGRRIAEKRAGAHQSSRPMPCGRHSPWKKKMDGRVVRRDEE